MKTIILTGVTGAIGRRIAMSLAKRGDVNLVIAGRNRHKLEEIKTALRGTNVEVHVLEMDLSLLSSVKQAVESIKSTYRSIDALINIAAVYKTQKTLTSEGYETMFVTNHLGPFAFTTGILPVIKATPGGKVITVSAPSSTKINFDNLNSEQKFSAFNVFGGTKMMNLLFAFKLATQFHDGAHASIAFHPGLVKSDLLNEAPAFLRGLLRMISSSGEKTAGAITALVWDDETRRHNNKFYNNALKELKPAAFARDENIQQKLWEASEKMLAQG